VFDGNLSGGFAWERRERFPYGYYRQVRDFYQSSLTGSRLEVELDTGRRLVLADGRAGAEHGPEEVRLLFGDFDEDALDGAGVVGIDDGEDVAALAVGEEGGADGGEDA